ncbi:MAG: carbohydrate porin [Phycisphaerales bacterium]|nr:MAG: carbohydrate porin [Phycisphaerales bacterium]
MCRRGQVNTIVSGGLLVMLIPALSLGQGRDERPPESDAAKAKPTHGPFDMDYKYMTGDWGGVRSDLEDLGVKFKISLMNQLMANMHGGKETKNGHDTAGSYELNIYFDMEKLLDISDATFWIRGKGTWGGDDSDFDKEKIGGLFKTNQDASSEEPIFVDKWHWQQFLFDKKLELRLGRQEPVKDLFDTSKIMGHEDKWFLNRALIRNATIPSTKGLGIFAKWTFSEHAYVSAAALDGHARSRQTNFNTAFHDEDEFRFFAELGCKPKFDSSKGKLWGHYRVGTWYDPTRKQKFRDTMGGLREEHFASGDWGYYLGFDQMVWKENDDPKDKQGFAIAARYGRANGEVNKVEDFWSFATQYAGMIPGRDNDLFGIGVGQGILADEYERVHAGADRETVYEMYYAIYLAPWLIVSPDLQYITNVGGDEDDTDAFVAGLRFKMSL